MRLTKGNATGTIGAILLSCSAYAQTDLVVNGQFASGLSGWTVAPSTSGSSAGTCGYNPDTAPGTEALTSIPGFTIAGGASTIALGSVSLTANGFRSCVLYQDIAIPVGATTATITLDGGIKLVGGLASIDTATFIGLYSTASVPAFTTATLGGSNVFVGGYAGGTALVPRTSASLNVSSLAGTTVRLAIINAMESPGSGSGAFIPGAGAVVGVGNVHLNVNVSAPPTVTGLSPASGVPAGGAIVTITGTNLTGATAVRFGTTLATFVVVNATTITATVPAGAAGGVNVTVTTPAGTSAANAANLFTYALAAIQTPTLSEWGMIALTLMLGGAGFLLLRRRSSQAI